MRFGKEALLSLAALSCWLTFDVDAFLPHPTRRTTKLALFNSHRLTPSRQAVALRLAGDDDVDDDDEEEYELEGPLAKGIDSVDWLPSVIGKKGEPTDQVREGAEILPLFPLGGFVYTPNTEHVLNIFEPRYRQMYTDILMNGTKRFVVATSHPTEKGRFAKTGVLFELQDLKEVSEQTADQIKYICNHKVTGRVTINKVLNPEAWENRDTYLKVEGTIIDDSGKNDEKPLDDVYGAVVAASRGSPRDEEELRQSFKSLVDIQYELEEDVRFTKGSIAALAVADGPGTDGLWQTVGLWQSFADQRLMSRQNELQMDFQEKLQEFLKKEKGMKEDELPSAIGFQDLSPALKKELKELQKRMAIELQPLVLESSLTMQKILEAKDHKARCQLLKYFIDAERRRLDTKRSLKGLFSGKSILSASADSSMPLEEMIADDDKKSKSAKKSSEAESKSIFFDEPDAFQ